MGTQFNSKLVNRHYYFRSLPSKNLQQYLTIDTVAPVEANFIIIHYGGSKYSLKKSEILRNIRQELHVEVISRVNQEDPYHRSSKNSETPSSSSISSRIKINDAFMVKRRVADSLSRHHENLLTRKIFKNNARKSFDMERLQILVFKRMAVDQIILTLPRHNSMAIAEIQMGIVYTKKVRTVDYSEY